MDAAEICGIEPFFELLQGHAQQEASSRGAGEHEFILSFKSDDFVHLNDHLFRTRTRQQPFQGPMLAACTVQPARLYVIDPAVDSVGRVGLVGPYVYDGIGPEDNQTGA